MKVSLLKTEQRIEVPADVSKKIRCYGKGNDYPQKILDLKSSSGTLTKCLNIYFRFVLGRGIKTINNIVINEKGERFIDVLRLIVSDYVTFGGRAWHVNYNLNGEITSIYHVPLEFLRYEIDDERELTGRFVYYDDWNCRKRANVDTSRFVFINRFNPDNVLNEVESVGGIEKYNGQVLYMSNDGVNTYPTPIYDAVISDIATEDGIATIKYRNVKNNYLPSGILATIGSAKADEEYNNGTIADAIKEMQGDSAACKILHVEVDRIEEIPKFTPFEVQNFDKEFEYSEKSVQSNIGNIFMQPPVLRGELVAGKLGTANEIKDAYDFYNSITDADRQMIEDDVKLIFSHSVFNVNLDEIKIWPLNFYGLVNNSQ